MTHPSPKRNMVPKAVLMRSGLVSLTTARPVNTAQPRTTVNSTRPMTNVFNKAHSTVRRLINNKTTTKNRYFNQKVNTVSSKNVNTARPKVVVNIARPKAVLNAVKGNHVNAVKASACWGNPQQDLEEKGVIDNGCSRHMTGNMSYLTDFEEFDGGYVAFRVGLVVVFFPSQKSDETSGILSFGKNLLGINLQLLVQELSTAQHITTSTNWPKAVKTARPNSAVVNAVRGKPQQDDTRFVDSGCSRHMTGNIAYLSDFKEFNGGY
ncbi:hypothetical protein Tco_0815367, partial [Tanacetum coccineum]